MCSKIKIICEIGQNHNGDIDIAKKLIDLSAVANCDFVKFQKRDPDICVPNDQKDVIRNTPWGKLKYIDYRHKLEFNEKQYNEIDAYCSQKNIKWFASVWDLNSAKFMKKFSTITKIPSALLTNLSLGRYCREHFEKLILSTGMSSEKEVEEAVNTYDPDIIFHTNSTYPCPVDELNLEYIRWLKNKYKDKEIGYSGHEYGLVTTFATISMGVSWIERHVTLDKYMWGSDHISSIEPTGLFKLVKGIRDTEKTLYGNCERIISKGERKKIKSLKG